MCVLCNLTENDIVEAALAVQNTFNGEYMTIPIRTSVEQLHTFDARYDLIVHQDMLLLAQGKQSSLIKTLHYHPSNQKNNE